MRKAPTCLLLCLVILGTFGECNITSTNNPGQHQYSPAKHPFLENKQGYRMPGSVTFSLYNLKDNIAL